MPPSNTDISNFLGFLEKQLVFVSINNYSLFIKGALNVTMRSRISYTVQNVADRKLNSLCHDISNIDWNVVLIKNTANTAYNALIVYLQHIYETHFQNKIVTQS